MYKIGQKVRISPLFPYWLLFAEEFQGRVGVIQDVGVSWCKIRVEELGFSQWVRNKDLVVLNQQLDFSFTE